MCKKFNNNAFGNVLCFAKPQSLTETRNEKHQQPQHMSKPCLCPCLCLSLSLPSSLCLCLSCAAHLPPAGACFCFCLDRHAEFMVLKHAKVQLESNRELGRIESAKHTHTHTCIRYLCVHAILQKASSPKPPEGWPHTQQFLAGLRSGASSSYNLSDTPRTHSSVCECEIVCV